MAGTNQLGAYDWARKLAADFSKEPLLAQDERSEFFDMNGASIHVTIDSSTHYDNVEAGALIMCHAIREAVGDAQCEVGYWHRHATTHDETIRLYTTSDQIPWQAVMLKIAQKAQEASRVRAA